MSDFKKPNRVEKEVSAGVFSRHRPFDSASCSHLYNPLTCKFIDSVLCSACKFCNYNFEFFPFSIGLESRIFHLGAISKRIGETVNIVLQRFEYSLRPHASLRDHRRFSYVGSGYMSHLHCHYLPCSSSGSGINSSVFSVFNHFGSECLGSVSRPGGCAHGIVGGQLAVAYSEGSPTTAWSAGCARCKCATWHGGLGGVLVFFYLMLFFRIGFCKEHIRFELISRNGNCRLSISNYAAGSLFEAYPWMALPQAKMVLEDDRFVKSYIGSARTSYFMRYSNVSSKIVESTRFFGDVVGNYQCQGKLAHQWVITYPNFDLCFELFEELNRLFDSLHFPMGVCKPPGRSCRAMGLFGIPEYNPRMNMVMHASMHNRNRANRELFIMGYDRPKVDNPVTIIPETASGAMVDTETVDMEDVNLNLSLAVAEGDSSEDEIGEEKEVEVAHGEKETYYDDESDRYYQTQGGVFLRWLTEESADEFEKACADHESVVSEFIHSEVGQSDEEIEVAAENEDAVAEDANQRVSMHRSQTPFFESLTSSVGNMIVSHADFCENLHKFCDAPLEALNESVRDFGYWMRGFEEEKKLLKPSDFGHWVNHEFKSIVGKLSDEIRRNGDLLKEEIPKLSVGRDAVITQLHLLEKAVRGIQKDLVIVGANFEKLNDMPMKSSVLNVEERLKDIEKIIQRVLSSDAEKGDKMVDAVEIAVENKIQKVVAPLISKVSNVKAHVRKNADKLKDIEAQVQILRKMVNKKHPSSQKEVDNLSGESSDESEIALDHSNRRPSPVGGVMQVQMPVRKSLAEGDREVSTVGSEELLKVREPAEGVLKEAISDDLAVMPNCYYPVDKLQWKTDSAPHVSFHSITTLPGIFKQNPWLKAAYQMYQYFRCSGMLIKITTTSNAMQGGILMICWDAICNAERRKIYDMYSLSQLPNGKIAAGADAELIFKVNFDTVQERLSLAGKELGLLDLGTLMFVNMCPLVVPANTAQYVDINVFVKFIKGDFLVRTIPHEFKEKIEIKKVDKKKKSVAVAEGDGVMVTSNAEVGLGNWSGVVRPNILHAFKWAGNEKGRLLSLNVHPVNCRIANGVMIPTSLSMVSSLYHYWSGTLKYRFYFGANRFMTGKLFFVALPGQFILEDPADLSLMGVGGTVFSLNSESKMYEVEVPFYGISNSQRVSRAFMFDSMFFGEDMVTRLHVFVVDPIVTNVGSTDSIHVAVEVIPGEDFSLRCMRGLLKDVPEMRKLEGDGPPLHTGLEFHLGPLADFNHNWGYFATTQVKPNHGIKWRVCPMFYQRTVAENILSWVSSLFGRWSGSIDFKFLLGPHDRKSTKYMMFWHLCEEIENNGTFKEASATKIFLPPKGHKMVRWDMADTNEFHMTVGFQSRFKTLVIPHSGFEDVKHHPSFYYNGAVYGGYSGNEDINLRIFIKPGSDFKLYNAGPLNTASEKSGEFILPYIGELTSVESTMKDKSQEVFEAMLKYGKGNAEGDKGIAEGDSFGKKFGRMLFGEETTAAMQSLDVQSLVDGINATSSLATVDFGALSEAITKVAPLLDALTDRVVESKDLLSESKRSVSVFGEMGNYGSRILGSILSMLKDTTFGFIAKLYGDGEVAWSIVLTIALFLVGIVLWKKMAGCDWSTKIALGVCIIWAPFVGVKVFELFQWLSRKLKGVTGTTESVVDVVSGDKSGIHSRGVAEGDYSFVFQMLEYSEAILGTIFSVVVLFVLKMMPGEKTINSWTSSFADLGRKASSFTSIGKLIEMLSSWGKRISSKLVDFVYRLAGKETINSFDEQMKVLLDFKVSEWVEEVAELSLEENKWTDVNSDAKVMKIRELFDKSLEIQKVMLEKTIPGSVISVIRPTIEKCNKLINETYSAKGLGQARIDPIHFAFIGKPGVGKSAMVQNFVRDLMDSMKYPRQDRLYSRSCADQYWSRYYGQPVVLYDDLGALSGDPSFSDYGEFINLKANVPYALNMADIDSKGTMFRSHVLVSTSNVFWLDGNTNLRTPEAYYRRRDVAVLIRRCGEMNPANPTEGILFTVVDTNTCLPRTEWPFFMNLKDGEQLAVVDVDYKRFVAFCLRYAKGYMKVQGELVKQANANFRDDISEDVLEAEITKLIMNMSDISGSDDDFERGEQDQLAYTVENFPGLDAYIDKTVKKATPARVVNRRGGRRNISRSKEVGDSSWTQKHHRNGKAAMEGDESESESDIEVKSESNVVEEKRKERIAEGLNWNAISLEKIIAVFDSMEYSPKELIPSFERVTSLYIEEFDAVQEVTFASLLNVLCSCDKEIEGDCVGSLLWRQIRAPDFNCTKSGDGTKWIMYNSGKPLDSSFSLNMIPEDVAQFFCGIIQMKFLVSSPQCCVGRSFEIEKALSECSRNSVEAGGDDEEEFFEPQEDLGAQVYEDLKIVGSWYVWNNETFASKFPRIFSAFGGIPLRFGGQNYFIGDFKQKKFEEVSGVQFDWVLEEMAKVNMLPYLLRMCKGFDHIDLLIMRSNLNDCRASYEELKEDDTHKYFDVHVERFSFCTVGFLIHCLLFVAKVRERKMIEVRRLQRSAENEKMKKGVLKIKNATEGILEGTSPWFRKALVVSAMVGGTLLFAGSAFALWKGFNNLFGLGLSDERKEKVEDQEKKEVPIASTSVEPVVVAGVEMKDAQLESTFGSGDLKTKRMARSTQRKIVKRNLNRGFKNKWTSQDDDGVEAEVGLGYTNQGLVVVGNEAMQYAHMSLLHKAGADVEVKNERLMSMMPREHKVFSVTSACLEKLAEMGKIKLADFMIDRQVEFVDTEGKMRVVVYGGTPFIIPHDFDKEAEGECLRTYLNSEVDFKDDQGEKLLPSKEQVLEMQELDVKIPDDEVYLTLEAEGGDCVNGILQDVIDSAKKNMVQFIGLKSMRRIFGVMVAGSWMLISAHYLGSLIDDEVLVFMSAAGKYLLRFDASRAYAVSAFQDACLIDLGPKCPMFKDITRFFISEKSVDNYVDRPGFMLNQSFTPQFRTIFVEPLNVIEKIDGGSVCATTCYDTSLGEHVVVAGFRYPAVTGKGFCGSLLVSGDKKAKQRFIGIHSAGHSSLYIGYGEMITQESLRRVFAAWDKKIIKGTAEGDDELKKYLANTEQSILPRTPKLNKLGVIRPEFLPRSIQKTEIKESVIHGLVGPVLSEPSVLTPFDPRLNSTRRPDGIQLFGICDPLLEAVEKYAEATRPFSRRSIGAVERFLVKHYHGMNNSIRSRQVLNEDVAINGIDYSDSYLGIEMNTSPGWPHILKREKGVKGKEFLFERVENFPSGRYRYKVNCSFLRESIDEKLIKLKQGRMCFCLGVENAKDERRKLSKIYEKVATRSFTTLEVGNNLLYRRYFLDFGIMVQENFMKSFTKVGIDPLSAHWTDLMHSWLKKSTRGFAGDYAKFDGIGDPEIYMSICRVINKWYNDGEENARVREVLVMECFHRVSLIRDTVVEINQGMPSGFPFTVIFNSIVNFYFLGMAWMDIVGKSSFSDYATIESFYDLCGIATYGDDNVVVVPEEILTVFNLKSVAMWLKDFGIVYTDEQKRPLDQSEESVNITTVSFLKRKFRKLNNSGSLFVGILDKVSIEEQLHWVKLGSLTRDQAIAANIDSSLREAYVWGREYFEDLRSRILRAIALVGSADKYFVPTYGECHIKFWNNYMGGSVSVSDLHVLADKGYLGVDSIDWETPCVVSDGVKLSLKQIFEKSRGINVFFDIDDFLVDDANELAPANHYVITTTNAGKASEYKFSNPDCVLSFQKVETVEIQGTVQEIALTKFLDIRSKLPFERHRIVSEDVSLDIADCCLGPYIKFFSDRDFISYVGRDCTLQVVKCIENADKKGAKMFMKMLHGKIVLPRGSNGFGFDKFFEFNGKTLAERTTSEKMELGLRSLDESQNIFICDI
uniref:Polyprotein n=1 Tax=Rubber waikavirus TaxID=3115795 RepID=A0AAT9JBR7_9SECO